jgi:urease accessory protein
MRPLSQKPAPMVPIPTSMSEPTTSLASLRLMQLVSPALPVGAFSYSQGLEQAVESAWVTDAETLYQWISGIGSHSFAALELPLVFRLHSAWLHKQEERIQYWDRFLLAARETKELRLEDQQMGQALHRLLDEFSECSSCVALPANATSFVTQFTRAAVGWGLPVESTAMGLSWTYLENQVAAALKLLPLGQTEGQLLLSRLSEQVPAWLNGAQGLPDEDLICSAPGLVQASSLHEYQYTRLFRT